MKSKLPIGRIRTQESTKLRSCACLMASSSPWSRLQFGIEQCEKLLRSRALQLWGCKDGESVVGFAALRPDGIEGEPLLEYICVDQEQRGKHVGSSLIEALEAYCKKKRDRNIYLFVSDFNLHAIRLYERLGYFRVGAIPDYNVYGQTEYLYRKALGEPRQQEVIREKHPGGLSKTQGASAPARDLNAGYARIEMPQRMLEAVLAASSAAFRNTGRDHPKDIDDELHRHILEFFCRSKPSQQVIDRTFSTFSGSIALDRVFGAIRRMHSRCESMQVPLTVILPEPSLDLWQQLLRDRSSSFSDVEVIAVRDFTNSRQRTRNIIDQVESVSNRIRRLSEGKRRKSDSMIPERKLMVLIDNPSNPQGFSMELQELQDLAKACKKHDAVMVLDHCFLLAGIHFKPDCRLANGFADLTEQSCDWYAMWDTGKSLDLAGDKVAFVTASSQYLAERLRDSLSVIQPLTFTAVRSLSVLVTLFENRDGILDEYLASAENLCSRNLEYLRRAVNKLSHCTVNSPAAGSFAILSCDLNVSSQDLATFWREEAGTGVALGKDFFAARFDEGRPPFVRLSLYKPASVFEAAVSTAASKWPAWVQRTKAVAPRRRIHRARPAD